MKLLLCLHFVNQNSLAGFSAFMLLIFNPSRFENTLIYSSTYPFTNYWHRLREDSC